MEDLTLETIVALHDGMMAESGEDTRIVSEGNLHQLVFRANLMDDVHKRAAFVFWSLCAFPAFCGGNGRTARRLAETILASGGHTIDLPCEELHRLVQGIDAFNVEIDDVEQFLHSHSRKTH